MKRGMAYLKKLLFVSVFFSILLFTCGFVRIKVRSVYPEEIKKEEKAEESLKEETEGSVFRDQESPAVSEKDDSGYVPSGGYYGYGDFTPELIAPAVLPEIIEDNGADIFLVGDSRTVYAYMDTCDERANWLAACGSSYPYFVERYLPLLDRTNLRGKKIVILYGINDVSYYGKEAAMAGWLEFYNGKAQDWIRRGAAVYACSVLGFDYSSLRDKSVCSYADIINMNRAVEDYNTMMEAALPSNIGYIKLHYTTDKPLRDGVHYSYAEDRNIYEGIINYLK